ncbi:MAG TPA: lysophospholipid acyltransferase family protein [Candidatus Hypogeohydataceae bacterium YC41]
MFRRRTLPSDGHSPWTRRFKQKIAAFYDLLGELVYRVMWIMSYPVVLLFFRLEVQNPERIPEGPVIIAANHHSYLDPWVLQMAFPRRIIYMVGHVFYRGLGWWFYRMHKAIPLKQKGLNLESFKKGLEVLQDSGVIAIFPEGWGNGNRQAWQGNPGVAMLAAKSHVPVLPARISGAQDILRKGSFFPHFVKLTVTYGEPIHFNGEEKPDKEALRKMTDLIMERIKELA